MYLDQESFSSSIYSKTSCELNCTSKGFSCNFLDLVVNQVIKVYPVLSLTNIFNQSVQVLKWFTCLMFIPISQFTAKLRVINSQFYKFLRLCSCNKFFVFQMVSLIDLLKNNGYPLKILLKRTRKWITKEKFFFEISASGVFRMILYKVLLSGEILVSPPGLCSSLLSFMCVLSIS
jgi:hypothetical protein